MTGLFRLQMPFSKPESTKQDKLCLFLEVLATFYGYFYSIMVTGFCPIPVTLGKSFNFLGLLHKVGMIRPYILESGQVES